MIIPVVLHALFRWWHDRQARKRAEHANAVAAGSIHAHPAWKAPVSRSKARERAWTLYRYAVDHGYPDEHPWMQIGKRKPEVPGLPRRQNRRTLR